MTSIRDTEFRMCVGWMKNSILRNFAGRAKKA